ncbi:hypothetical protein [Nisaea sediminum]|uniref:hypothetical protein n=1 Tax=Nisaea sediminum TaxID=2775867 RepID=UPI001867AF1E|nr:hypothetical protein [Nisaea sediminum]
MSEKHDMPVVLRSPQEALQASTVRPVRDGRWMLLDDGVLQSAVDLPPSGIMIGDSAEGVTIMLHMGGQGSGFTFSPLAARHLAALLTTSAKWAETGETAQLIAAAKGLVSDGTGSGAREGARTNQQKIAELQERQERAFSKEVEEAIHDLKRWDDRMETARKFHLRRKLERARRRQLRGWAKISEWVSDLFRGNF